MVFCGVGGAAGPDTLVDGAGSGGDADACDADACDAEGCGADACGAEGCGSTACGTDNADGAVLALGDRSPIEADADGATFATDTGFRAPAIARAGPPKTCTKAIVVSTETTIVPKKPTSNSGTLT